MSIKNCFVAIVFMCSYIQALPAIENGCNIQGLDKRALLRMLYDNTTSQSQDHLASVLMPLCMMRKPLSDDDIENALKEGKIDYLKGVLMKINIQSDILNTYSYNREHGKGRAEAVIERLRKEAEASLLPSSD